MDENTQVQVEDVKSDFRFSSLKKKITQQSLVVAATAVVAMPAFAAAELDFTGFTENLDAAKVAILGILATLIIIAGIVMGYRVFMKSKG